MGYNETRKTKKVIIQGYDDNTLNLIFWLQMKIGFNKIITSVKKNKESKVVVANLGYLSLLQIAGHLFPLITIPYLSKVIGAVGFGKIAFASAIITWIQTIVDWGFNYTATRDVAENRNDKEYISDVFSNVLWARLFLSLIAGIILLILVLLIPSFRSEYDVIFITFLLVPGHILFPDWFFQAVEKMKYTTIFNLAIKTIFTIAVFVFIKTPQDYLYQPLFTSIGYLLCGIISMWLIVYKWGINISRRSINEVLSIVKESTDVFINNIVHNLYNSASVVILGIFGGNVATGVFDAGNKFVGVVSSFLNVISRAFFPFLARHIDKHRIFSMFNLLSSFIVAVSLFVAAPWLIKLFFTSEFYPAINVLRILSISIFFINVYNTYGVNYLIVEKKEKLLRKITTFCSIIGFCLSIPLIYYYGYYGAALSIALVRLLLGIATFFFAKKEMRSR